MKKTLAVLSACYIAFFSLTPGLYGQTVSVLAFQEGREADEVIHEYLVDLVSACMDGLFYSGFIATSERPSITNKKAFEDPHISNIQEAETAFISYEILLFTVPKKSAHAKSLYIPGDISWRLISTTDGKVIKKGSLKGMEDGKEISGKIGSWCQKTGKTIMDACIKALLDESRKGGS